PQQQHALGGGEQSPARGPSRAGAERSPEVAQRIETEGLDPLVLQLESLNFLSISKTALEQLPTPDGGSAAGTGQAVRVLNLSNNQLESLPRLGPLSHLLDMYLSNNRLTALPDGIDRPELSSNKIADRRLKKMLEDDKVAVSPRCWRYLRQDRRLQAGQATAQGGLARSKKAATTAAGDCESETAMEDDADEAEARHVWRRSATCDLAKARQAASKAFAGLPAGALHDGRREPTGGRELTVPATIWTRSASSPDLPRPGHRPRSCSARLKSPKRNRPPSCSAGSVKRAEDEAEGEEAKHGVRGGTRYLSLLEAGRATTSAAGRDRAGGVPAAHHTNAELSRIRPGDPGISGWRVEVGTAAWSLCNRPWSSSFSCCCLRLLKTTPRTRPLAIEQGAHAGLEAASGVVYRDANRPGQRLRDQLVPVQPAWMTD
uniref:LRRcap domain-containing protein n=1 Tax=Macrostomum lignano TaxID=282301 RepID=A0A1I8FP65_9PLAT